MMKFALNHPWKFESYIGAFFVGFMQAMVVISNELINLAVLNTNNTIMDILMNFLALVIISDFDDYFFVTVSSDPMAMLIKDGELEIDDMKDEENKKGKILLEKLLKIEVTTSERAKYRIAGNRTDGFIAGHDEREEFWDRKPNYIHFPWSKRRLGNKVARAVYCILKSLFACIWFYFIPFSCLYLAYAIPFVYTDSEASRNNVDPLSAPTIENVVDEIGVNAAIDAGLIQ